jgi:DNA-binding protein YbaB
MSVMPSPQERLEQLQQAVADYPRRLAELSQRAAEAAARTVTGEAGGGRVTVTAIGRGEIRAVRLTHRALRELDNRTLADEVSAAINDALDRADAVMADATHGPAVDSDVDDALGRYERRMDNLLYQLDYLERSLDRLAD